MKNPNLITLKDKRKVKNTAKVFASFSLFFVITSVLIGVFTPKQKVTTGINNNEDEPLIAYNAANYGEEYLTASTKTMQRYSTTDNSLLKTYNYANDINNLVHQKTPHFNTSTFSDITLHYENKSDNNGTLLLFDTIGDIFKYNVVDGNYSLANDYYLTERIYVDKTLYKETMSLRSLSVFDHYLYCLFLDSQSFVIKQFDVNDLSKGVIGSKVLYTLQKPNKDQKITYGNDSLIVSSLDSKSGENPFDIRASKDFVFIFTSNGLHRISNTFKDTESGLNFCNDGVDYFVSKLKEEILLPENATKLAEKGFDAAYVASASNFCIKQLYRSMFGAAELVKKETLYAKEYKNNNPYVIQYDPSTKDENLVIYNYVVDGAYNLKISSGANQVMGGTAYSTLNGGIFYYLDIKDNSIYGFKSSMISRYENFDKKSLADNSFKTSISFNKKSFYETRGNIGYDYVSNTIHVTFQADRDIAIIDAQDENLSLRYMFAFEYDTRGFQENRDGSKVIAFYQTEKRTINNVASFPMHIGVFEPKTYQYRSVFTILMIVSIVIAALSIIALLVALRAFRKATTLIKLKVLKRDVKRNKWTYVAVIPFIVLLIMFCYVEAIGSISFSFFSYTMNKPSYIWNDFGNYIQIFNDKTFWLMFGNTLFFLVFDLFVGLVPPIAFAFCLSVIKSKKLSGVLRALMFIPGIVPGIAALLIWKVGIYGDSGILNQVICLFRYGATSHPDYVPVNFLHDESIARYSLLLMGFPYVGGYLIFYGGLMNIPKEYDEACQLEGIGVVKRFFTIDLPLIKPQIKYILVMCILGSVQNYERTYMLGSSGTTTLVESMYRQMKDVANPNYGLASAYATIIFIMLIIPVWINFRKTKKDALGDML